MTHGWLAYRAALSGETKQPSVHLIARQDVAGYNSYLDLQFSVVAQPHGRLHFAGEHTLALRGTMESALPRACVSPARCTGRWFGYCGYAGLS